MATHKRRNMVVFGGVVDEHDRDDLRSTFYADLHVFRMDQVPPPPSPFLSRVRSIRIFKYRSQDPPPDFVKSIKSSDRLDTRAWSARALRAARCLIGL